MSVIDDLRGQINDLEKTVAEIQEGCSHPEDAVSHENVGNMDEYGRSEDGGRTHYHCRLCDKKWTVSYERTDPTL